MCWRFVVLDGSSARTCVSIEKRDVGRCLGRDWMLSEFPREKEVGSQVFVLYECCWNRGVHVPLKS